MIGLSLGGAKQNFFDRQLITNRAEQATLRNHSRWGAYVRTAARSSIRPRKAVSQPGAPPSSHVGTLRTLILFALDRTALGVVAGPVLFRPGSDVPEKLEYGGQATRTRRRKQTSVFYRARPYMQPAADKVNEQLSAIWRNSVR